MQAQHAKKLPAKWPFPARRTQGKSGSLSRGAMVADICMVAAWGAAIPGLMWLGAAGGF
ncbi:MAG: hypothetical protein WBA83_02200 [Burkholderiaceae bacterium]